VLDEDAGAEPLAEPVLAVEPDPDELLVTPKPVDDDDDPVAVVPTTLSEENASKPGVVSYEKEAHEVEVETDTEPEPDAEELEDAVELTVAVLGAMENSPVEARTSVMFETAVAMIV
jgi:hypothetical protein